MNSVICDIFIIIMILNLYIIILYICEFNHDNNSQNLTKLNNLTNNTNLNETINMKTIERY